MTKAPILLFTYNRPAHFQKTIRALQANNLAKDSVLHIFSDGPKNNADLLAVEETRKYIQEISGFKKLCIYKNKKNLGLAKSVISGVSTLLQKNDSVIVLEDDLVTHPYFLQFMNESLAVYKQHKQIFSITGYTHPTNLLKIPKSYTDDVYVSPRASSWGWAIWKDRWESVEWSTSKLLKIKHLPTLLDAAGEDLKTTLFLQGKGVVDSWAVRFCACSAITQRLTVYPVRSLVDNIGMDGSGRHSSMTARYKNNLNFKVKHFNLPTNITTDPELLENFLAIYKTPFRFKVYDFIKSFSRYL